MMNTLEVPHSSDLIIRIVFIDDFAQSWYKEINSILYILSLKIQFHQPCFAKTERCQKLRVSSCPWVVRVEGGDGDFLTGTKTKLTYKKK